MKFVNLPPFVKDMEPPKCFRFFSISASLSISHVPK